MRAGILVLAIGASLAFASGARAQDERFAKPVAGTLTVKLVIDGSSTRTGNKEKGEKATGTLHREANGSIYLDRALLSQGSWIGEGVTADVESPQATAAPPNEMEEMGKAMEACKGDVACMQAVAMKMQPAEEASGEGDEEAAPAAPAYLQRYAVWTATPGRSCFKGSAVIQESYQESYTESEWESGGGDKQFKTDNWTVSGSTPLPAPDAPDGLCDSGVSVDTKAGTYDLRLDLCTKVPATKTKDGKKEDLKLPLCGKELVIKGQPLPASGTTLTGSASIPGLVEVWPNGKADATVSWTFKPGS